MAKMEDLERILRCCWAEGGAIREEAEERDRAARGLTALAARAAGEHETRRNVRSRSRSRQETGENRWDRR